jgi:glutaredoxin 3
MVFAKSTCKYCKNSKKILDKIHKKSGIKGWNARFLYLDYMSADGPKIHAALLARTGQSTVPNVFIGGKHVGGNTELTKMFKSGDLLKSIAGITKAKATA